MPNLGPTELIIIGFVLLILAAIIATLLRGQTPKGGQRLLHRWGIKEPSLEQGEAAASYLRTRRRRYVPVFVGLWIAIGVAGAMADGTGETDWILLVLSTVIATLLISEVTAMLRPALLSERSAVLVRRRVRDLVPLYGIIAFATVTVIAAVTVVANLFLPVEEHRIAGVDPRWLGVGVVVLVVVCSAVVWLSLVRGRLYDDGAVDAALRIRTARVAVGAGLLLMWSAAAVAITGLTDLPYIADEPSPLLDFAGAALDFTAVFMTPLSLICWALLVNPWRKQRLVEAYR